MFNIYLGTQALFIMLYIYIGLISCKRWSAKHIWNAPHFSYNVQSCLYRLQSAKPICHNIWTSLGTEELVPHKIALLWHGKKQFSNFIVFQLGTSTLCCLTPWVNSSVSERWCLSCLDCFDLTSFNSLQMWHHKLISYNSYLNRHQPRNFECGI